MPVIAGVSVAVLCAAVVWAQAPPRRTTGPKQAPNGANAASPAPAVQPPDAENAGAELPEGFQAPRSAPPEFADDFGKELATAEELKALERSIGRSYSSLFRRADMSAGTQGVIKEWAKLRVYSLTLKENRRKLHDLRNILMRDIAKAGDLVRGDPQGVRRFREMLAREVHARAVELLDNNFYVRLQAVLILGNLTLVEHDDKNNIRAEAYTPAAEALHKLITDPNQHQALKIAACGTAEAGSARGLTRILLLGTLRSDQQKTQIARDLITELNNPGSHPWYQMRLAEALGAIDLELSFDEERKPITLDALSQVAADKNRDLCVRAQAAKALGRAPLAAGTSEQVLAWILVDVAHDLALQYDNDARAAQQQKAIGPLGARLARWPLCFWTVYLAYQSTEDERKLYAPRKPGLLAKRTGDKFIADAYGVTVPAAAHAINQPAGRGTPRVWQRVPDQHLKSLADWLAKNVPAEKRLHAKLAPLKLTPPAGAPGVNGAPADTQPTSTTAGP